MAVAGQDPTAKVSRQNQSGSLRCITAIEMGEVAGEMVGIVERCNKPARNSIRRSGWDKYSSVLWFQRGNNGYAFCIPRGSLCGGPGMVVYRIA